LPEPVPTVVGITLRSLVSGFKLEASLEDGTLKSLTPGRKSRS
jgi:hypothetical protein